MTETAEDRPRPAEEDRPRIVVVGGGLAGLTAAALLGRRGHPVVVLEKSGAPGGRARTAVEQGFHLNLGPHALYRTGTGARILEDLGAWPGGGEPDAGAALGLLGGELHPLPSDPKALFSTGLLGALGKLDLGWAMARFQRTDPGDLRGMDVAAWLQGLSRHQGARQVMEALVRLTTYAHDPGLAADAAAAKVRDGLDGVLYPHGGWQTLVDALAAAARSHGVEIRTGVHGEALVVEGRRIRGVRTRGETLGADAALLALPIREAARIAAEHAPGLQVGARKAVPTRMATLDLGLSGLPRPGRTFVLGVDRPLYFSVHSAVAELAPQGGATVHASRYLGPGEEPDPAETKAELEAFLDRVQPGWRDREAVRRFLPSMEVSSATPRGSEGGLPARPSARVPGLEGLYLAGDWVGPEGLLSDASLTSAGAAATAVVEDLSSGGREGRTG